MKKQLILAIAFLVTLTTFAQKAELKSLQKAIKSSDFAEAKTLVSKLTPMLDNLDSKSKSKFFIQAAKAYFANGSASTADVTKAVALLNQGPKESSTIVALKSEIENSLTSKANKFYTNKQFGEAAATFESLYNVNNANPTYLYFAASSAVNNEDMDSALKNYVKLNDLGYTGVRTEYFATNKATGIEEIYRKKDRDYLVKTGKYINPVDKTTKSKVAEITKNIALIYVQKGENDKALEAINKARKKNPNDANLILSEANVQLKLGNKDKYQDLIATALKTDPNNTDLLYNLAITTNESGDKAKAKEYYLKALSIKPNSVNTLNNLAGLILSQDTELVEQMNNLGSSSADNQKYDDLKEQRTLLYKEAVPYLEKVLELKPNNSEVANTLVNIYSSLGEDAKSKALKAKYN